MRVGQLGDKAILAASFGHDAAGYAAHRPGYPTDAVAWMAGLAPVDVLDLAAGTGALTKALSSAGHHVVAADSSLAMLQQLTGTELVVSAAQATAEGLPFAAESFDVVTVATAFHWFDGQRALREISRVLRPCGRLALVWNTRDERTPLPRRLGELLREVQPPGLGGDWGAGSVTALEQSPLFGAVEYAEFPFGQALDLTSLLGLVSSRSYVIELDARRRAQLFDDVTRLYTETVSGDHAEATYPHVRLPYRTQCWRASRE